MQNYSEVRLNSYRGYWQKCTRHLAVKTDKMSQSSSQTPTQQQNISEESLGAPTENLLTALWVTNSFSLNVAPLLHDLYRSLPTTSLEKKIPAGQMICPSYIFGILIFPETRSLLSSQAILELTLLPWLALSSTLVL